MDDLDNMVRVILDSSPDAAFGTAADFPDHAYVVLESEARCAIRAALLTAPHGWRLVPVEPTRQMMDSCAWDEEWMLNTVWRKMLAAAPEVK